MSVQGPAFNIESNMGQTLAEGESAAMQCLPASSRDINTSVIHSGIGVGDGQLQQPNQMPLAMLLQAARQQGHTLPAGSVQQQKLLASLSHLHLNGLQLTQLHSLRACPKLQVLYIYDNLLTSIDSLASNRLLTHVYCHNNQLTSLQGVQHLPLLQKLYAQGNCLSAVNCLTHAQHLEELHVSNQQHWANPKSAAAAHVSSSQCLFQQQQQHEHQQDSLNGEPVLASWAPAAAAGYEQRQSAMQQDTLMFFNDGCQVEHCLTSSPPTPLLQGPGAAAASVHLSTAEAMAGTHSSSSSSSSSSNCSSRGTAPSGLWFDPASLSAVSGSLRVLAAAGCGITDPRPLAVLSGLQVLDLASNAITSLVLMQPVLEAMARLRDLDLRNNPCTHNSSCARGSCSKYRDSIILAAACSLEQLDGQEVRPAHRTFLHTMHSRKAKARQPCHAALQEQQEQHQQEQQEEQQQYVEDMQLSQQAGSTQATPVLQAAQTAAHIGSCQDMQHNDWAIAAGTRLSPRGHAPGRMGSGCKARHSHLAAAGPAASGLRLQLPVALQACRAAGARPPAVGGFRLSPRKAGKGRPAAGSSRPSGRTSAEA